MTRLPSDAASGEKSFLGNIGIAWRIGFVVALGLLVLAATETISAVGKRTLDRAAARESAFTGIETTVLRVGAGALMLRRRKRTSCSARTSSIGTPTGRTAPRPSPC